MVSSHWPGTGWISRFHHLHVQRIRSFLSLSMGAEAHKEKLGISVASHLELDNDQLTPYSQGHDFGCRLRYRSS